MYTLDKEESFFSQMQNSLAQNCFYKKLYSFIKIQQLNVLLIQLTNK